MESFERERTILEYLKTNNSESIENLAKICNSSSMTIRRDIKRLIELKTIEQRHGFVSLNRDISLLVPYAYRETLNKEVKKIMALKAIQLIEDGDVIILDAGTSCIEIAYILNSKKNLTVITNDLNIANIVSNYDIEVYIAGGKIENKNYCSSSIDTIKYIKKFRVSKDNEGKCFLEITGKNNKTIIIIRQENSNFELYKNLIGTKYTEEEFTNRLNQIQKIDYDIAKRKVPKRFLKEYSDTNLMDFLKAKLIVSYYRYLTDEYNKITVRQEFFTEPEAVMRDNSEQNINIKERNQERINDIIDYELRKQALLKYTPFQVVQFIGRKTKERVDVYLYEKNIINSDYIENNSLIWLDALKNEKKLIKIGEAFKNA